MELDNQPPAQATGIGVNQKNKWMELLKKAIDMSVVR
jgi:hypothetical protein